MYVAEIDCHKLLSPTFLVGQREVEVMFFRRSWCCLQLFDKQECCIGFAGDNTCKGVNEKRKV